jgi:hypothetical protein
VRRANQPPRAERGAIVELRCVAVMEPPLRLG